MLIRGYGLYFCVLTRFSCFFLIGRDRLSIIVATQIRGGTFRREGCVNKQRLFLIRKLGKAA